MSGTRAFWSKTAVLLVVLLLLGMMFAAPALAGGTDASDNAKTVFVYADDASDKQVLLLAIPLDTLKGIAHGADAQDPSSTYYGSFIDQYPTPTYCQGKGVTIPQLLEYVQENTTVANAAQLTYTGSDKLYFSSCDGATANYTYTKLLGVERFYYPALYQNWDSADGVVADTTAVLTSGVATPPYLATESLGGRIYATAGGNNIAEQVTANGGVVDGCLTGLLTDEESLRLIVPQTAAQIENSTPTYSDIKKWVYKVRLKMATTSPLVSAGQVSQPTCVYTLDGTTLTITMACADENAAIYYSTIGGFTQTPLNLYSAPIVIENYDISTPFTLGVMAVRPGYESSTVLSASSANITDPDDAPAFTFAMAADAAPQVGQSCTVSLTLTADKAYTLYGGEYRVLIPGAYFSVSSVSNLASGWENGLALQDGNTVITYTYLNTAGQQVAANTPITLGQLVLTPLQGGAATLTVGTAILTKENSLAYNTVAAEGLPLTISGSAVLKGDVNGDGVVDTLDAIRLAKHLVNLVTLTGQDLAAADVNGDSVVDLLDAVRLAKYLANLISTL